MDVHSDIGPSLLIALQRSFKCDCLIKFVIHVCTIKIKLGKTLSCEARKDILKSLLLVSNKNLFQLNTVYSKLLVAILNFIGILEPTLSQT